jgi:hypothetical protein
MRKKVKLNPYVQLRMFYKGLVYKVYKENEDLYLEADPATEQDLVNFLENLKSMKFITQYEVINEEEQTQKIDTTNQSDTSNNQETDTENVKSENIEPSPEDSKDNNNSDSKKSKKVTKKNDK